MNLSCLLLSTYIWVPLTAGKPARLIQLRSVPGLPCGKVFSPCLKGFKNEKITQLSKCLASAEHVGILVCLAKTFS